MFIRITREGRTRYSIRFAVVCVFVFATGLTSALGVFLHWHFSRAMAVDAARAEYQLTATRTAEYLNAIDHSAAQTTRILASYTQLLDDNWVTPSARQLFAEVMQRNPIYYAIYVGFPNGDFYELVNLQSSKAVRGQLRAADSDRWVVIRVTGDGEARRRFFDYYDETFTLRISRSEPSSYFANRRIWYTESTPGDIHKTAPYMFQHLQAPGQTYSTAISSSDAVLAIDIALSSLSEYLDRVELSSPGDIFLFQAGGEVLASNSYAETATEVADVKPLPLNDAQRRFLDSVGKIRFSNETNWPPVDFSVMGEPRGYTVDLTRLIARMLGMEIEFVNGYNWPELVDRFRRNEFEVLQPVFPNEQNRRTGLLSKPILRLPYAVATGEGVPAITDIHQLSGKTVAVPAGWSIIPLLREKLPQIQIHEVPSTRHALQAVVNREVFATLDSGAILRYAADIFFIEGLRFHDIADAGRAGLPDELHFLVSGEHPELLELLNAALDNVEPRHLQELQQKWLAQITPQTLPANPIVPYAELIRQASDPQRRNRIETINNIGCDCFTFVTELGANEKHQEYFAIAAPRQAVLAPALGKVRVSLTVILLCFLLLMPLCWWFASPIVRPIKRLSAENDKIKNRHYDDVQQYDSKIIEVYELSKSIVEMSNAIKQHEMEQQALMDSFIKLIAQAIDEKSPYTGGHCARVPDLAIMLVEAAERSEQGMFRDFYFTSEHEKREFSVAAWLHDCGKIATPEHIVDKGTKLETIYNRIHEIRMRIEVLRRDAQIRFLEKLSLDDANRAQYDREFQQTCRQLEEDYAFIASINLGSEHVADEDIERLREIASIKWTRHFSNRLGLSPVEENRYPETPEILPVTESLLADRPEHIIPRREQKNFDPELKIDMEIPEHLYNLGEIHNLSVQRGTLTKEDRFKINEHMISTVKMLESLLFPAELSKVPKYASTHHETLAGTGYPRKLKADELEVPDRILAIADIYEALTAADRPYKKAKPISEAIQIISHMVESGKLCEETFRLFLSSGVYLDYANRYLAAEQIDAVDVERYTGKTQH